MQSHWNENHLSDVKKGVYDAGNVKKLSSKRLKISIEYSPLFSLLYANDIQYFSVKFNFYLFADDTNILYADKNIKSFETLVNCELYKVCNWLTANRFTLSISKSNYVIFPPYQKRLALKPKIVYLIMYWANQLTFKKTS